MVCRLFDFDAVCDANLCVLYTHKVKRSDEVTENSHIDVALLMTFDPVEPSTDSQTVKICLAGNEKRPLAAERLTNSSSMVLCPTSVAKKHGWIVRYIVSFY